MTSAAAVPTMLFPTDVSEVSQRAGRAAADFARHFGARLHVDDARRHGVELIVTGTHGRRGLAHALLGSVSETVVRRTPCPVMVAPAMPAAATQAPAAAQARTCVVCGHASPDLICQRCRAVKRAAAEPRG
jgi:nucleotide-binding universal stress UspA family protein